MSENRGLTMREILFRGKRADNGEWETGSLVIIRDGCSDKEVFIADKMTGYHTPVIPETVGQYTGLTDRNGTKIFEGDIVSGTVYSSEWIGVIVWIDEIASFGARYFHRIDPTAWQNSSILTAVSRHRQDEFAAQVIGNIYDNPELMKGGNNNG